MIHYDLGDTVTAEFSVVEGTPDATPAVNFYAGDTLLGAGTVSSLGGTADYKATYTLPGSGIANGTPIKFRANADVDSAPIPTLHGVAGVVGLNAKIAESAKNSLERENGLLDKIAAAYDADGTLSEATLDEIAAAIADLDVLQQLLTGISTGSIEVVSPVTATGQLNPLVRGNDYLAELGPSRTLSWTFDLPDVDLTGATCYFGARKTNRGSWLIEGTLAPDPELVGRYSAQFDLPSSATVDAKPDTYPWNVEVRTAEGQKITKITGTVPLIDSTTY